MSKNKKDIVEFISIIYTSKQKTHYNHLTTKSNSEHEALNSFYVYMQEFLDSFIEIYQGQYGIIDGSYIEIDTTNEINKTTDVIKYYDKLVIYIRDNKNIYLNESDSHLFNMIDELVANIYRLIYKLKNLK